jgi:MoxR-like ATPase
MDQQPPMTLVSNEMRSIWEAYLRLMTGIQDLQIQASYLKSTTELLELAQQKVVNKMISQPLPISNPMKPLRPSPTMSATQFAVGRQLIGNDNNIWEVTATSAGIHRWVKAKYVQSGTFHPSAFNIPSTQISNISIDPNAQQSFKYKQNNMSKVKSITKKSTQEVRTIDTSLINKEEVFKMLALAEATGLPCLLVGAPGVAKTKTIIDYAKAWLNRDGNMTAEDFANKIYILETDEGTKASEIKGMPDLGKLFTDNKYELNTPIADAEIVIINEVDKASSGIRNAMLGVMNEKFLFNGKHKIPCKWKLFVATCNEIPKDETGSPFWDRFMLKMTVNRVSAGELAKYFSKGARNYREKFSIGVPNKQEIESLEVPANKLEKYLEVGYQHSSDRTLTFVPSLTKAVSYIWDISLDKALVKTAQIMISQNAGSELQNKLMSPEVKAVMSKVEMLHSHSSNEQLELAIAEIESLINTYTSRGIMDEGQVDEIELSMQYILQNHPARETQLTEDFEAMMSEAEVFADVALQNGSSNPF